jgi:hypothetical protein
MKAKKSSERNKRAWHLQIRLQAHSASTVRMAAFPFFLFHFFSGSGGLLLLADRRLRCGLAWSRFQSRHHAPGCGIETIYPGPPEKFRFRFWFRIRIQTIFNPVFQINQRVFISFLIFFLLLSLHFISNPKTEAFLC